MNIHNRAVQVLSILPLHMPHAEADPLLPLSESYIIEACPNIPAAVLAELRLLIDHFVTGVIGYDRASGIFIQKIHTDSPLQRISDILNVAKVPIQSRPDGSLPSRNATLFSRKKNRPWTGYEDQRLLYALHLHGVGNWGEVSEFVGNGRTRAQCSQRWFRGLNPRISRLLWTPTEERKLWELVQLYGEHSWMKIATQLGNRSDSQCRYHFYHMVRIASRGEHFAGSPQINGSRSEPVQGFEQLRIGSLSQSASSGRLLGQQRPTLPSIEEILVLARQRNDQ
jgi:hypothetical protein